ncbi:MAG: hypothetical protein HN726_00905 [Candidatus Magasanikbacteria bacterium]|jgi:hypothetical protein|nr:hypothetical protein [Candidatus Magasanikbacteria bacterium]MBT4350228.1 hypothetical protein [Candidatus Magasanikbacteria bacterium]MBT4541884.1 hypothetical protein [Candidatus Magasanikbacteria bacterium]MBT6252853.1 hypothetical protein [Candidatus Magasanikbacteria bacterium]MBT7754739.1 hypothetical protein [Candidatus Magasanikbacteria bacterium]
MIINTAPIVALIEYWKNCDPATGAWPLSWANLVDLLTTFTVAELLWIRDNTGLRDELARWPLEHYMTKVPGTAPWGMLFATNGESIGCNTCVHCGVTMNPLVDREFLPILGEDRKPVMHFCSVACIKASNVDQRDPVFWGYTPEGPEACVECDISDVDLPFGGIACSNNCFLVHLVRQTPPGFPWYPINFDAKGYWVKPNGHERCEQCGLLHRAMEWYELGNAPSGQPLAFDAHWYFEDDDIPTDHLHRTLDGHGKRERIFCTPTCAIEWLDEHHAELHRVSLENIPELAHEVFLPGGEAPNGYLAATGPIDSLLRVQVQYGEDTSHNWSMHSFPTYYADVATLRLALVRERERQRASSSGMNVWGLPDSCPVVYAIADWYRRNLKPTDAPLVLEDPTS